MGFNEHKQLNLAATAQEILSFWEKESIFEKSVSTREGQPPYVFYEGPPSANGMPGIHHVMARAIKDIFCRYKTQKDFQVKRKAGWDTHGLPVELGVEKELGITKDAIGKSISVEEYNQACKNAVMRYTDVWNKLTQQMGYWVDMEDPYITYKSKYIESVWWLLKQIYDKDLLYKGYTIQPYSPKAGTGLSSHELNQPGTYQDVTDTTITAMFKTLPASLPESLKEAGELNILAWTTTPWTLPSNTALTVGKKIDYVVVETYNQYTHLPIKVLLAKALVGKQFSGKYTAVETEDALDAYEAGAKKIPYFLGQEIKGSELVGIRYEQLWHDAPLPLKNAENAFRVISGDFVTTEDGTGIVHTAPTFGADDAQVAKEATPPVPPFLVRGANANEVPVVDLEGKFQKSLPEIGGKYVKNDYYKEGEAPEKSVDVEIAIRLKEENRAFKVEKYVHSYPNCWRTDKPILYYPLDSWFIKVTDVRDKMVAHNNKINWKPKSTGEGRFGNWLANANDWNLSRSRFWGIPLPIWRTEDGKETVIMGSMEELIAAIEKSIEAGFMQDNPFKDFEVGNMSEENYDRIDLHKNSVDPIVLCSPSGQAMHRESDLIDVWFDSGSMPYAQWHYPFENKEMIDENNAFPADYIAEGVDQTRGWFYTLHAIGTLVFDSIAYKNVVSNGLVLDKNGQKMSKRLGNAADPFETLEKYGADATRWYMISNANPWDNLKFDLDGIAEVSRKFFGTLHNTYSFFSLYANIDGFSFKEARILVEQRSELDRWILSELNRLIAEVDAAYNDYEPTKATRAIAEFVQEIMSNWYVRLSRRRFWKGEYQQDKIAAYQTLFECLLSISKLMAPVAPFYADQLYRDLCNATQVEAFDSVHLAQFPVAVTENRNTALEDRMSKARTIASLALSLRKKEQIKVRQPLQKIMVPVRNAAEREAIELVADLIQSEINVKSIELLDDASDILVKEIKPNFKALGPRFGKNMKAAVGVINTLNDEQIKSLETGETLAVQINGEEAEIEPNDVLIQSKDIEGWLVANGNGLTVALDIQLDDDLINEGIAREMINRIQNLRKDAGFEVTDKIILYLKEDVALVKVFEKHQAYIQQETLAKEIVLKKNLVDGENVEFDQIKTIINLEKV
ncbi:MAG: isoleucine--tRNA ligase [Flavobacteriaceae bacterium]|nr:isoleucine--tRNA ligase [Flavobacteriaceae bacterium]